MAGYDFTEKGAEFIESFTDPGPPYDPAVGPSDQWFRRVVEHSGVFYIAFQHDGTVTYVSDQVRFLLGHEPADLVGTNALELIHPDDLQNAADTVYHAAEVEGWRPPRPFRLRCADGSYVTIEVEGMSLFHVEEVRTIVCIGRYAEEGARVDAILGLLVANAPLSAILDELVHVISRPGWHFGVAVQYDDGPGRLAIAHTGLPDELIDFDRDDDATPWGRACAIGSPVYDLGLATLTSARRAHAEAAGYHTCWAIPVPDPGREDACIVVWNHELHEPELGQEIHLRKFQQLLELALAGRARAERLEQAASTDSLSGLSNRRAFEAAVGADDRDGVAVLFLDLDGFKAVNDELGHVAGDEVIRKVGARILAAVRHDDVAARLGGDEFAVLCRGVRDEHDVVLVADRLLETVPEPIELPGGQADFGLSIGIAVALQAGDGGPRPGLEQLLELADRQLYEAKRRGKGRYALAYIAPADP